MRRRRLLELVASGVVGAVSGCTDSLTGARETSTEPTATPLPPPDHDGWPMAGYDAANTGHHRTASLPDAEPTKQWQYRREFDDDHGPSETYLSAPVVHDELVFAAEGGQPGYEPGQFKLRAFDATTGEHVWGHLIAQGKFAPRTPAVGDNAVFVCAESEHENGDAVEAVAVTDGERRWRREFKDEYVRSLVVAGDTLVVPIHDAVVALDVTTGEYRWQTDVDDVEPRRAPAAVEDGTVYVGSSEGVQAFDLATGARRWQFTLTGGTIRAPTVRDGTVYISNGDRVVAFRDGAEVWTFEPKEGGVAKSVAVDDGQVYAGGMHLFALDAATGTRQWTQNWGTNVYLRAPPVVANGTVISAWPGSLVAFDATNGTRHWKGDGPGRTAGRPAVVDGWLYVAEETGTLYAFATQPEN